MDENRNDYEFRKKLDGKVEIPENLKPENIEEMLNKKQMSGELEEYAKQKKIRDKKENGGFGSFMKSTKGLVTAASLVIILGAAIAAGITIRNRNTDDGDLDIEDVQTTVAIADYYNPDGDNYQAAYNILSEAYKENNMSYSAVDFADDVSLFSLGGRDAVSEEANTLDGAKTQESNASADMSAQTKGSDDYSETNIRTKGVDEGDVIKTDGKYIYVLKSNVSDTDDGNIVKIYSANEGQTELVSTVKLNDEDIVASEIFVTDDTMTVVGRYSKTAGEDFDYEYYYGYSSDTKVVFYNISDRTNPEKIGSHKQEGEYNTSRIVGDKLYLISTKSTIPFNDETKVEDYESYIPKVDDECVEEKNVVACPNLRTMSFTVVTSYCITDAKIIDSKAIVGGGTTVYMSRNNIYMADYKTIYKKKKTGKVIKDLNRLWTGRIPYDSYSTEINTTIQRVNFNDGALTVLSAGTCKGSILNDYSMDEYKDHLRVVCTDLDTSTWTRWNAVYIFDSEMKMTGSIENIAKKEEIKSARLMGDVGYFVTFLNTDPLFSVDLSDPKNPKLIGQLKIPGFSTYLHPWGENLLLGIGYDGDYEGTTNAIKLSMFDVSDPKNVKEVAKKVVNNYSYLPLESNTNAVLADFDKNLIGFSAQHYYDFYDTPIVDDIEGAVVYNAEKKVTQEDVDKQFEKLSEYDNSSDMDYDYISQISDYISQRSDYMVFSYSEEDGFTMNLKYYEKYEGKDGEIESGDYYDYQSSENQRGLYIGDYFYVSDPAKGLVSFKLDTFEQVCRTK
ncbi:MAG: beta-propeller domain-containing protein [Lachnospiraceae bacterium]|nr:beta-propeller domain-containing protein [Lachnospiraceae bacterium]